PAGFVKVVRDATAQKWAHDRLRESEQRLRLLVDNVRDSALLEIDPAGRIVYWNPGAERIFGYAAQEVVGLEYAMVFSREDAANKVPESDMALALAKGRAELERQLYRKDGSPFLAHWVTEPAWGEDEQLRGFVKVLRDRTESKRAEEQLKNSQRMEALGRLAGGVAHDFNNLLTVIVGYTTALQKKLHQRPELAPALAQVQEAAERAARLTAQLLAFSRKQVTQPTVLSVNELISGMEKMVRALLGEDIDLKLALAPEAGSVKADAGQIEQVIMNLAANARDAMPGGGQLRIRTENVRLSEPLDAGRGVLQPGDYVTIAVTDTGHGMDENTQHQIFEPFFTTKPVDKGTGLGLATSHGIAEQSGGTLTVESKPGQGACFTLYLPLIRSAARSSTRRSASERRVGGSGTILLVEDEAALRQLFLQTLTEAGYTVLEAANGEEALRVAAEHTGSIDLLLTDVIMPKMGGAELAAELRGNRSDLRVLFVSGFTNHALEARGIFTRGARFLQKPFQVGALLDTVSQTLKQRSKQSRSSGSNS
ncbi:MAG: PAS domain S-box protein, partial [Acidobacteriota bacterium]|nr:PAS domain S-box protein [Acidobacteriota bacterium]